MTRVCLPTSVAVLVLFLVLLGIGGQPLAVMAQGTEAPAGQKPQDAPEAGKLKAPPNTASVQDAAGLQRDSDQLGKATQYSLRAVGLALALIALMAVLFFLLFYWSSRVERAGFFAVLYRDTVEKIEYGRLSQPIDEEWTRGEYHRELVEGYSERAQAWLKGGVENRKPDPGDRLRGLARQLGRSWELDDAERQVLHEFRVLEDYWATRARPGTGFERGVGSLGPSVGGGGPPGSTGGPGGSAERISEEGQRVVTEFQNLLDGHVGILGAWVDRARTQVAQWREQDLAEIRAKANAQADRALDVDFSALRGRGSEFVLEFTTVVVIIFAAVILGVLKVLNTEQIGTLLAAIAGYVLGRSTSRGRSTQAEGATTTQAPAAKPSGTGNG